MLDFNAYDDVLKKTREALNARRTAKNKNQKADATRHYFSAAAEALSRHANFGDPLPSELCKQLSGLLEYLGAGLIPAPIKEVGKRGRTTSPQQIKDEKIAVAFVRQVRAGKIRLTPTLDFYKEGELEEDNFSGRVWITNSIEFVENGFGVKKNTVYGWLKKYEKLSLAQLCEGDEAGISVKMGSAAKRYKTWGNSTEAIRGRDSKRDETPLVLDRKRKKRKQMSKTRKLTAAEVRHHRRVITN